MAMLISVDEFERLRASAALANAATLVRADERSACGWRAPYYGYRTMTDASDAQGNLLPDVERLTPCGRFLRSTSLDELPELRNVLRSIFPGSRYLAL